MEVAHQYDMHTRKWQVLVSLVSRFLDVGYDLGNISEQCIVDHRHFINNQAFFANNVLLSTCCNGLGTASDIFRSLNAQSSPVVYGGAAYVNGRYSAGRALC